MENCAVCGSEILCPLLFDMNERPLSAAELKMLEAGELEEILLRINHPIRVQVTPAGSRVSSKVTV